jgi:hypothetical protein
MKNFALYVAIIFLILSIEAIDFALIGGDCCHDLGRILDEDNIVLRDPAAAAMLGLDEDDLLRAMRWR